MDRTATSTGERLVLAAGALLVFDLLFLPWYHINIGGLLPIDRTALEPPQGWLAVLAWLGTLALLAQIVVPRLGHHALPRLSWSWSRIALVEGLAVLGLLLGQIGTAESMQPIMSIVMMVMSLLGGVFIPIDGMPSGLLSVAKLLPSYWLTQIGRGAVTSDLSVGLGHAGLILVLWAVVLGVGVTRRYRRDSARV